MNLDGFNENLNLISMLMNSSRKPAKKAFYRDNIAICLLLIGANISYSQFGINIRYLSNDFNEWSDITTEFSGGPIWENNVELAVDYWFRPEEIRTEYYVEGTLGLASTSQGSRQYDLTTFGLGIRSHVYIFDFRGDCDCPTFTKEGGLFKKGFFLQYGVGTAFWLKNADPDPDHNNLAIDLHAGAGFDIGVSDLLTVSPYVSYHYIPNVHYDGFIQSHDITDMEADNRTSVTRFRVGVRIGFRPDFLQERRALYR